MISKDPQQFVVNGDSKAWQEWWTKTAVVNVQISRSGSLNRGWFTWGHSIASTFPVAMAA
jgi:hypothetical protein